METWIYCTIDELGDVIGGATPSTKNENYWSGNISWITPKDLSRFSGRYISRGERNISMAGLNSCSSKLIPRNSILFSSRAPIGYVGIAANDLCTNQGFKSIVPSETTDSLFLYYLLKYNTERIESLGSGTTFKEVSGSTMKGVVVFIPKKKDVQISIGRILSSIDEKIELNQRINDNLAMQVYAIFKSWFVDYEPFSNSQFIFTDEGNIPAKWKITNLESCCSLIVKGITPRYSDFGDQKVINQKCIRNGTIDLQLARKHIPKVVNEKWLKFGDILINSTGEGTLGRVAQVCFTPTNLVADSHVTIIRPSSYNLIHYLGCLLLTKQSEFEGMASGSTGQTDLPRDLLKGMSVVVPDEKVLESFSRIVSPLRQKIIALQEENINLVSVRDVLLPKLMSGEIDVSQISN